MRYILNERFRLRGWYKLPSGLFDNVRKTPVFLDKEDFLVLLKCDGAHDFDQATQEEKEILEELDGNEEAKALLEASGADLDDEEGAKVLAAVARETGYDVADEEVADLLKSRRATLVKTSDAAVGAFLKVSDDELDDVAGGKEHDNCTDTYKSNENCMWNDNCKKVINMYYEEDEPYCDSYSHCKGVAVKPNCLIGKIGF